MVLYHFSRSLQRSPSTQVHGFGHQRDSDYPIPQGERRGGGGGGGRGGGNALFLHCQNFDLLAVVAVAHFYPHLAGRHLAIILKADDCFSRL